MKVFQGGAAFDTLHCGYRVHTPQKPETATTSIDCLSASDFRTYPCSNVAELMRWSVGATLPMSTFPAKSLSPRRRGRESNYPLHALCPRLLRIGEPTDRTSDNNRGSANRHPLSRVRCQEVRFARRFLARRVAQIRNKCESRSPAWETARVRSRHRRPDPHVEQVTASVSWRVQKPSATFPPVQPPARRCAQSSPRSRRRRSGRANRRVRPRLSRRRRHHCPGR